MKYYILSDDEKENIVNIHHVFCGLHVLHNVSIFADENWEEITEEMAV